MLQKSKRNEYAKLSPTFARYCFTLSDLFSSFCNFHVFVRYMLVRDSAWSLKSALLFSILVRDQGFNFCCCLFVSQTVSVRLIKGLIFLKFIAIIVILITLARMMLLLALFSSLLEKLKDLRLASVSSLCVFLQVKMVKGFLYTFHSDGLFGI